MSEAPVPSPSPPKGKPFGRYLIQSELGRGGMGIVYKAVDPQLQRTVALKVLIGEAASADPDRVKRFIREATSIAKLRHPNVVQIHDIGKVGAQHYFTMDYIEGSSLEKKIVQGLNGKKEPPKMQAPAAQGPQRPNTRTLGAITSKTHLPGRTPTDSGVSLRAAELSRIETAGPYCLYDTLALMRDMARALGCAHVQGLVHRDVKPANILLDHAGTPFLTDFGLAKDVGDVTKSALTLTGTVMGTPKYMSPEQAAGRISDIASATDVWSLGVVLYEMLTGRVPFDAASLGDILHDIAKKNPPAPSAVFKPKRASSGNQRSITADQAANFLAKSQSAIRIPTSKLALPGQVDEIVMKCLEKDAAYRYEDGNALGDDIDRYLRGEAIEANATVSLQQSRITAQRKHSRAAAREVGQKQLFLMLVIGIPVLVIGGLIYMNAARTHAAEEKHEGAIAEAKRLMEAKDWKKAQEYLSLELSEYPGDPALDAKRREVEDRLSQVRDTLYKADQAFEKKDYVNAQTQYREALALDPKEERSRVRDTEIGKLLWRLDDDLGKGEALLRSGNNQEALQCFNDALSVSPGDPRATSGAERAKNAMAIATNPVGPGPPPPGPRNKEAEGFYQRARNRPVETREVWQEALENIEKALAIDAEYGDAWYERGVLHAKLGAPQEALQDFGKAIQYGSFLVYAHYFRGRILFDEFADLATARTEFEAAIRADPTHEYVLAAQARIAAVDGNLQRALDLAKQALSRTKSLDDVYFVMGFVYGSDQFLDLDKALECFNKAIELNPTISASWGNRSIIHYMRKEYANGLIDAEKALELTNNGMLMWEKKALNLKGMQRYEEAVQAYDQAEKTGGDHLVSTFINRGDCYKTWAHLLHDQGQNAKARSKLERAIADWEHFCTLMTSGPYFEQVQGGLAQARKDLADWK